MRNLAFSKTFRAVLLSLVPTLVNVTVTEMFEFSIHLRAPFSYVVQSVLETQSPGSHKEKRVHGKKVTQTTNNQQHQTKEKSRQDAKDDKPHDLLFARHACQVRTEEIFFPFKVY